MLVPYNTDIHYWIDCIIKRCGGDQYDRKQGKIVELRVQELGIPIDTPVYLCRSCCVAFESIVPFTRHMTNHSPTDQQKCARSSHLIFPLVSLLSDC